MVGFRRDVADFLDEGAAVGRDEVGGEAGDFARRASARDEVGVADQRIGARADGVGRGGDAVDLEQADALVADEF